VNVQTKMGEQQLAHELKRISSEHQEEKKKLQLSIQMEKARQRQKLLQRRKLRQSRRAGAAEGAGTGATTATAEPKVPEQQNSMPNAMNSSQSVPALSFESKQDFKSSSIPPLQPLQTEKKVSAKALPPIASHLAGRPPTAALQTNNQSLAYLQGRMQAWS